jgi:hypothetical protein
MEYRPSGMPYVPLVVKNLLIINAIVFVAMNLLGKEELFYDAHFYARKFATFVF